MRTALHFVCDGLIITTSASGTTEPERAAAALHRVALRARLNTRKASTCRAAMTGRHGGNVPDPCIGDHEGRGDRQRTAGQGRAPAQGIYDFRIEQVSAVLAPPLVRCCIRNQQRIRKRDAAQEPMDYGTGTGRR